MQYMGLLFQLTHFSFDGCKYICTLSSSNQMSDYKLPSNLYYNTHFSTQLNCWSLRCNWSIACRRCSNYNFFLHLTLGFNILRNDNCKPRRGALKFWHLVRLILETLRYYRLVFGHTVMVCAVCLAVFLCPSHITLLGPVRAVPGLFWTIIVRPLTGPAPAPCGAVRVFFRS